MKKLTYFVMLTFTICSLLTVPAINSFAKEDAKLVATEMININTATSDQLQTIKGIGVTTAERIIAEREKVGEFKSVDDLLNVKGIGPKSLAKIRSNLTVK